MPQSRSIKYRLVLLVMFAFNAIPSWSTCVGNCQCSVTTTALNFGVYTPSSASPTSSSASVQVKCNTNALASVVTYSIALSAGNSGNFNARTMINGASALNYNLYSTATGNGLLGDGTNGTQVLTGTLNLAVLNSLFTNSHSIYGIINAQQNPTVGAYSDSVIITVTY